MGDVSEWVSRRTTNLSLEIGGVGSVLILWADVKFEKLFELVAAAAAAAAVAAMLLFDCDEARLLFNSGTEVTVTTLFGVWICVVTTGVWFKYSPLPIIKTVDWESPPSSLADESSRAYRPWLSSMKPEFEYENGYKNDEDF